MQVSVSDPAPIQPSKIEIVISEFASERLEMEQKYFRLQEVADKVESNARVHEHKAQKIVDVYTKAKSENKNLYIANKKLWGQVKNSKMGCFFGTQKREGKLLKNSPINGKYRQ